MWASGLATTQHPITAALLRKTVLPSQGAPFERVSAALSVRVALKAKKSPQTLFFLVPNARESTALLVTAGLLVGDIAHCGGGSALPADEVGHLFKGDVLFVTPAVAPAKAALEDVSLKGVRLKELWRVESLSKYRKHGLDAKPHVYVTNPGWIQTKASKLTFGAVVVDASHPRTLAHLREIIDSASSVSTLRIVVCPPLEKGILESFGYPNRASAWLWDPTTMDECAAITGSDNAITTGVPERVLLVCDEDPEANAILEAAHSRLVSTLQQARGKPVPGLLAAWGILNRLRNLVVPLTALEEQSVKTYRGSLRARLEGLKRVEGYGNPLWEVVWPEIVKAICEAYRIVVSRCEPAKFWVLANRVEVWLKGDFSDTLRIVVSGEDEATILVRLLGEVIDTFNDAVLGGRIDVTTAAAEARLTAVGNYATTILAGPRSSSRRHLDVYPKLSIEVLVYPFEAGLEQATQNALYCFMRELDSDANRAALVNNLGFKCSPTTRPPNAAVPRVRCIRGNGAPVEIALQSHVSAEIDIAALAQGTARGWLTNGEEELFDGAGVQPDCDEHVIIRFLDSTQRRYPPDFRLDVYFAESEQVQRVQARHLQPGQQIISFVDGYYDGLFERLREAVYQQLPNADRVALELWHEAKTKLVERFDGNRSALYAKLKLSGLASEEATTNSWFRDEDDVLAPQQIDDFMIVAKATGVYPSEDMMKRTFAFIQHERGRGRKIGRALAGLLRAIASGDGYEDALASAQKMDASLSDVLSAVELLQIDSVRLVPKAGNP